MSRRSAHTRGTGANTFTLHAGATVVIKVASISLLVARVLPPSHSDDMRDLIRTPTAPSPLAPSRGVPLWAGPRLTAIDLRTQLRIPARSVLTVRFALSDSEPTLRRKPDKVVLVDAEGWQEFGEQRSLCRGLVLPAGPAEVLDELFEMSS